MTARSLDADAILDLAKPLMHQQAHEMHLYGHIVRLPIALSETPCQASIENLHHAHEIVTMRHAAIALALFVSALAVCAKASGQRPPIQRPVTSMSLPVSSSVLATIVSTESELMLLVLWRSEKGWHSVGPRRESGGGRNGTFTTALQYGDVQLDLQFDPAESQATVQGTKVSVPARSNVLLVDGVDSRSGLSSVKALPIDSEGVNVDPRKGSLAPLLGRSPEVVHFLRCDDAGRKFSALPAMKWQSAEHGLSADSKRAGHENSDGLPPRRGRLATRGESLN